MLNDAWWWITGVFRAGCILSLASGVLATGCAQVRVGAAAIDETSDTIVVTFGPLLYTQPLGGNAVEGKIDRSASEPISLGKDAFELLCDNGRCYVGGGKGRGFVAGFDRVTRELSYFEGPPLSTVWVMTLSADGEYLATGHGTGEIIIWDTASRSVIRRFGSYQCEIYGLAFVDDDRKVVAGLDSGAIEVWDVSSGEKTTEVESPERATVFTVSVHAGRRVLVGKADGSVYEYEYVRRGLTLKRILDFEGRGVLDCDMVGDVVVCGLTGGYIGVVGKNERSAKLLRKGEDDIIFVGNWIDGGQVIAIERDGTIRRFDAAQLAIK